MSGSHPACKPCRGSNVAFACRSDKYSFCRNDQPFSIYAYDHGVKKVVVFAPIDPDSDIWTGSTAPLTDIKGGVYALVLVQEDLVKNKIDDISKGFVFENPNQNTSRLIPLIKYFDQVGGLKDDLLPVKTTYLDQELTGTAAYFLSRIPRSTQRPDQYISLDDSKLLVHGAEAIDACCVKDQPALTLTAGNSNLVITPMSVKCWGMTVPVLGFAHESTFQELKEKCPQACCRVCEMGNKRMCVSRVTNDCLDQCEREHGKLACGTDGDEEKKENTGQEEEENEHQKRCRNKAVDECGVRDYVMCEENKSKCIGESQDPEVIHQCNTQHGDCGAKAIPGLCSVAGNVTRSDKSDYKSDDDNVDCTTHCKDLCDRLGEPLKIRIESLGTGLEDMDPKGKQYNNLFWAGLPVPLDTSHGNQRLPAKHQVANKCVPLFNGNSMIPYLLAYANYTNPSLNYNLGPTKLDSAMGWRNLFTILKNFRDKVEDGRKQLSKSVWYGRLSEYGKQNTVFNKFYYSLVGNNTELWVMVYLTGTSSIQSTTNLGSTPLRTIDFREHRIPKILNQTEQLTLLYDESASSQNDSCWLPVYHDCRVSANAGLSKIPSDVCSGRASKSNEFRCEYAYSLMSDTQKKTLIDTYCTSNPHSFDCQCYRRTEDQTFSYLSEKFSTKIQVKDSCWWKPCIVRDNTMFVTPDDDVNCGKACFNLLWVGNSSNVDISGLTQITTCGSLQSKDEDTMRYGEEEEKEPSLTEQAREHFFTLFSIFIVLVTIVAVLYWRSRPQMEPIQPKEHSLFQNK